MPALQPGTLSLADLASLTEDVPVGDNVITVRGISASDGLAIFLRFPDVAELLGGFTMVKFIKVAPAAVAAILATATGSPGDADAEEDASKIGLETQIDMLEAVGRLTFSKGFGPFAQRIMDLAAVAVPTPAKASGTTSQPQSKASSQPDILPE